jgi:hypothetical protein
MTPLNSSVDTEYIGSQTRLSSGDIQSLNKAYSCEGRISTYGGGNDQVGITHCFIMLASFIDTSFVHPTSYSVDLSQVLCFFFTGMRRNISWYNPIKWDIAMVY